MKRIPTVPGRITVPTIVLLALCVAVAIQTAVMVDVRHRDAAGGIPSVVAEARPAVVSILVARPARFGDRSEGGLAGSDPGPDSAALPTADPADRSLVAAGSGFIVDPDGIVVTNAHTIADATRIVVRLVDGSRHPARRVGVDPRTDIAVLAVETGRALPSLPIAEPGSVAVGDPVIAIGDPFGYAGTATFGAVSALDRPYGNVDPIGYLQHDAAINPGSSGGPLLDARGRVVGINTAIADEAPFHVGLSLSIPAEVLAAIVDQLRTEGRVSRGFAGVTVQAVGDDLAAALGLPAATGVIVAEVQPGSPAAESGLGPDDVILALDGRPVADLRAFSRLLFDRLPNETITFTIDRGGESRSLDVTLAEAPAPSLPPVATAPTPARAAASVPALRLSDLDAVFADEVATRSRGSDAPPPPGTAIADLARDGLAARLGLRPGDVIRSVGRTAVTSSTELARAIAEQPTGPVALRVERPGETTAFIVVDPPSGTDPVAGRQGNSGARRAGPL